MFVFLRALRAFVVKNHCAVLHSWVRWVNLTSAIFTIAAQIRLAAVCANNRPAARQVSKTAGDGLYFVLIGS